MRGAPPLLASGLGRVPSCHLGSLVTAVRQVTRLVCLRRVLHAKRGPAGVVLHHQLPNDLGLLPRRRRLLRRDGPGLSARVHAMHEAFADLLAMTKC
jgi:hypothetical protein